MKKIDFKSRKIALIILIICIFFTAIFSIMNGITPQQKWVTDQYGTTSDDTIKLEENTELKIVFTINKNNFEGISIRFLRPRDYQDEILECFMYDEQSGELLAQYQTYMRNEVFHSSTFLKLPYKDSENKKVSIIIKGKNLNKYPLFYISENSIYESQLYINDEVCDSVLVFSSYFKNSGELNYKAFLDGFLIIFFLLMIYIWHFHGNRLILEDEHIALEKTWGKFISRVKSNKKIIVFCLLVLVYVGMSVFVYQCYVDEAVQKKQEAYIVKPKGNTAPLVLNSDTKTLIQTFKARDSELSTVYYYVNVKKYDVNGKLRISVYDEKNNKVLDEEEINISSFANRTDGVLEIFLQKEFTDSKGKIVKIAIEPIEFNDTEIEFLTVNSKKNVKCYIDGVQMDTAPVVGVSYYNYDFLKCLYVIYSVIIFVFLVMVYYTFVFREVQIKRAFIPIVLFLGMIYMFAIPLYAVPDEYTHLDTAYAVSNQMLGIEECEKPGYMYKRACDIETDMAAVSTAKMSSYRRIYTSMFEKAGDTSLVECYGKSSISNASTLYYFPAAIGITVGRLLNFGAFPVFMLGRFCNLLAFVLISYWALCKMPYGKNIFMVVASLPIVLQEAASFSYDGMINGVAFLFLAYCFSFMSGEGTPRTRDIIILLFTLGQIASVKGGVYLPLCFLVLLIPYERNWKIKGNLKYYIGLFIFIIVSFLKKNIIALLTRLNFEEGTAINGFTGKEMYTFGYLFKHPLKFVSLYINTLFVESDDYLQGVLGGELGSHQLYMPWINVIIILVVLIALNMNEMDRIVIKKQMSRVWISVIFLATVLLVCLSMLVSFTAIDYNYIEGVQGRYFIPGLLLPCILLGNCVKNGNVVDTKKCLMLYYINQIIMFWYIGMIILE